MSGLARERPALLLVTGSRAFFDRGLITNALDHAWTEAMGRGFRDLVVVHGGAKGADKLADEWAHRRSHRGVSVRRFPADWAGPCTASCQPGHRRKRSHEAGDYCPAEGGRRNQRMVEHVTAQMVPGGALALVFLVDGLWSRGTQDCWRRIRAASLPYRNFTTTSKQVTKW